MQRVVLAYSGGLDTSVAIRWLAERYQAEVIAVTVDVGEERDLEFIQRKALSVGAIRCHVIDARREFAEDYVFPALQANGLYEGKYPLSAALSRPLISRILVDIAHSEGATAVAHGCTGKGNDQVRFDVSITALDPNLRVIAPVREWPMSREDEIQYAARHQIPVPITREHPFSLDENLWGRSIECGVLEDPWIEPPREAFAWTVDPTIAPSEPEYVEVEFQRGNPVALDGERLDPVTLIERLNRRAGDHGVGRIDMIENRLVGIKSREVYEAPAATVLVAAHRDLESLTLPRQLAQFKPQIEQEFARLTYFGLWFSPLRDALSAFIDRSQLTVTGTVRVRLYRGNCQVVGRKSPFGLYDRGLATYDQSDRFDHTNSEGFISLWGLPTRVYSEVNRDRKLSAAGVSLP